MASTAGAAGTDAPPGPLRPRPGLLHAGSYAPMGVIAGLAIGLAWPVLAPLGVLVSMAAVIVFALTLRHALGVWLGWWELDGTLTALVLAPPAMGLVALVIGGGAEVGTLVSAYFFWRIRRGFRDATHELLGLRRQLFLASTAMCLLFVVVLLEVASLYVPLPKGAMVAALLAMSLLKLIAITWWVVAVVRLLRRTLHRGAPAMAPGAVGASPA